MERLIVVYQTFTDNPALDYSQKQVDENFYQIASRNPDLGQFRIPTAEDGILAGKAINQTIPEARETVYYSEAMHPQAEDQIELTTEDALDPHYFDGQAAARDVARVDAIKEAIPSAETRERREEVGAFGLEAILRAGKMLDYMRAKVTNNYDSQQVDALRERS